MYYRIVNSVPNSRLEIQRFDSRMRLMNRTTVAFKGELLLPQYTPIIIYVIQRQYTGDVYIPYFPYNGPIAKPLEANLDIDVLNFQKSFGDLDLRGDGFKANWGSTPRTMALEDLSISPGMPLGFYKGPANTPLAYQQLL